MHSTQCTCWQSAARGLQTRSACVPVTHSFWSRPHSNPILYPNIEVREFLMLRLYQLRKPKTNISIIQQNVLLRHKYFVRFVRDHGEDVYAEVGDRKSVV